MATLDWVRVYREYIHSAGYQAGTITQKERSVRLFAEYLKVQLSLDDIRDVTEQDLRAFLTYLNSYISRTRKELLSESSKVLIIWDVKQCFRVLYWKQRILTNPAKRLSYRKRNKKLRVILSQEEMERVFAELAEERNTGHRDRVLCTLLYSSGLRSGEAAALRIGAIDFESRSIQIRKSKFGKDRYVPMTEEAAELLKRYLGARMQDKESYVFPGSRQRHLGTARINELFKYWAAQAGVYKPGLCSHSIRHSVATHLLENGAGIRYVQELLGHESLETTVCYTRQVYSSVRRMYKRYHPRENEYYQELTPEYLTRIEELERRLVERNRKTARDRRTRRKRWE